MLVGGEAPSIRMAHLPDDMPYPPCCAIAPNCATWCPISQGAHVSNVGCCGVIAGWIRAVLSHGWTSLHVRHVNLALPGGKGLCVLHVVVSPIL